MKAREQGGQNEQQSNWTKTTVRTITKTMEETQRADAAEAEQMNESTDEVMQAEEPVEPAAEMAEPPAEEAAPPRLIITKMVSFSCINTLQILTFNIT
jgi:hypothetical protein